MIDAAAKYGYEADEIPLDLYDLKEPSVKKTEQEGANTCYLVNIKHGMIDSNVKICWNTGKIVSIEDAPY